MNDNSLFSQLSDRIKRDEGAALAVVVRGPDEWLGRRALIPADDQPVGPLLDSPWRQAILADARDFMSRRLSTTRCYPLPDAAGSEVEVFFDVTMPAPPLIIVGAVHIAGELLHFARRLGFRTYLVDPRTAFATPERFPHVDVLITRWPDEALPEIGLTADTSVVVVTHDPKLDDPALLLALPSPASYVGALGSPKTHARRVQRLLAAGLTDDQVSRLHAPIGLNIGGRTPAEIALSIVAEIVAVRSQGRQ